MKSGKTLKTAAIILAAAMVAGVSGTGLAQTGQPSPLHQEFMELQQRMTEAEQNAFQNTPQLRGQLEDMEELFADKMRAAGYDPGAIMETLLVARGKLETPGLTDAQRQEILQSQEVADAQRRWAEAQRAIMNDPEVQKALQSFDARVKDAMRLEEPELDGILERMQDIQQQIMRQQQQGSGGRR